MQTIFPAGAFMLGAIIGSFLNVLIFRYNTGRSLNGRSACLSCGKKLSWYELAPILSFLWLRGRCGKCGSRISFQYPLVEFLSGILFLGLCLKFVGPFFSVSASIYDSRPESHGFLPAIYFSVIFSLLLVIAVYDIKHKIIPDGFVFSFAFLSFFRPILFPTLFWPAFHLMTNLIAGPLLALPFFLLWFFSGGRWIGLGDAKFALGLGWLLGPVLGISAVLLGFWAGAFVGLALIFIKRLPRRLIGFCGIPSKIRLLSMKSEIPFAPFLIFGTAVEFFWQLDVAGLSGLFRITGL